MWGWEGDVTPAFALGKQFSIHASLSTSLFLGYHRVWVKIQFYSANTIVQGSLKRQEAPIKGKVASLNPMLPPILPFLGVNFAFHRKEA